MELNQSISRNSSSNNRSEISKQVAALDDADVWIQQLVVTTSPVGATTKNTEDDIGNDDGDDGNDKSTSSSEITQYYQYISIMNQIGKALYELEYHYCTCYCCHAMYHVPVEIQLCHHIFCSYCIRTKFYSTTQHSITHHQRHNQSCPICNCSSSSNHPSHSTSTTSAHLPSQQRQGSSSLSSSLLSLIPNHRLDTFVHVFRLIRQPLLQTLKLQQQILLQQLRPHQEESRHATLKSSTSSMNSTNGEFQHLPKLLHSIQRTIRYLQRITNNHNSQEQTQRESRSLDATNVPITDTQQIELEIQRYVSKILKYSNDGTSDTEIPYPTIPKTIVMEDQQHRPTLTKVIINNKTTKKQLIELLCQKCGFNSNSINMITANYSRYYKNQNNNSNTNGDVEIMNVLRKMYTDYIRLYNSENDTLRPRSPSKLLSIIVSEQMNIFNEKCSVSPQQPLQLPSTITSSATSDTTVSNGNHGPIDYDQCIKIIKQQRKMLGEASSLSSSNNDGTTKPKFWTTVTTGHAAFDTELATNFQQLIHNYYERYPLQKETRDQLVQQYFSKMKPQEEQADDDDNDDTEIEPSPTSPSSLSDEAMKLNTKTPPSLTLSAFSMTTPTSKMKGRYDITRNDDIRRSSIAAQNNTNYPLPIKSLLARPTKADTLHDDTFDSDNPATSYSVKRPLPLSGASLPVVTSNVTQKKKPKLIPQYDMNQNNDSITKSIPPLPPTVISGTRSAHASTTSRTKTTKMSTGRHTSMTDSSSSSCVDSNSLIGPWICAYCTYYNTKDRSTRARCEICTNIRGSGKNSSSTMIHNNTKAHKRTVTAPPPSSSSQSSSGSTSVIEIDC